MGWTLPVGQTVVSAVAANCDEGAPPRSDAYLNGSLDQLNATQPSPASLSPLGSVRTLHPQVNTTSAHSLNSVSSASGFGWGAASTTSTTASQRTSSVSASFEDPVTTVGFAVRDCSASFGGNTVPSTPQAVFREEPLPPRIASAAPT